MRFRLLFRKALDQEVNYVLIMLDDLLLLLFPLVFNLVDVFLLLYQLDSMMVEK